VALIVTIGILLLGLIFLALRYRSHEIWAFVWPTKDDELQLSIDEVNESPGPFNSVHSVDKPIIPIAGSTNKSCQIDLFLDGKLTGRTTTIDRSTTNKFEFAQVMLHPGQNFLVLKATLIRGASVTDEGEDVSRSQTIDWTPRDETDPVLYRVPKKVTTQPLQVEGAAVPDKPVVLSVIAKDEFGSDYKKVAPDVVVTADDQGHFKGDLSFPQPGRYFLFPHRLDVESIPKYYRYDRSYISFVPNSRSRIVLSINYDQILIDLQDTRPKNDPAAENILSGHNSLAEFIHREFDLHVNGESVSFEFLNVEPEITTNEDQITIRAQATINRSWIFPVQSGNLKISRGYENDYPVQGPDDTLEVIVNDYTTQAYSPAPNSINYPSAVWTGKRNALDVSQGVQVSIAFNPTKNPRNVFRVLSLSPYQLFDRATYVFSLLISFLSAVPIVWFFYLLQKYPNLPWIDAGYIKRFKRFGSILLGLLLLPGIQRFANSIANEFYNWVIELILSDRIQLPIRLNSPNNPVFLACSTLGFWLISVLLLTIVGVLVRSPSVRSWLSKYTEGITTACLLYFLLLLVYWIVLIATKNAGESFLPTTVVALVILAFMALSIGKLARARRLRLVSLIYLTPVLVLLVVMAYPANRSIYSLDTNKFSTWEVTRANLTYFFGMIQDFVPYIFLVGIFQILRAANRRQDEIHPFISAVALLLFSCYVISTTLNWFIIPIPFLLALKLYPHFLALPPKKVNALNYLKPVAIERRRWFLDRVFDLSLSQRLLSSLDQMEKKIAAGDLAIEEFLKRRSKLETYAAGVREDNNFFYDLEAKDLALSLGPYQTNWLNGIHALKRGLVISLPFILFYLLTFLLKQIRLDSPFVFLWTTLRIIEFMLDWAVYAFFFGYFFNQLKGELGLKKGLRVALVVIACLAPVWLTSGTSTVELSATFLRAGQIFMFFTVLGVWAFDYHTFRNTLREQFSWKRFAQFGDMPSFTAVVSVLLTSVGVAFTSVLKGRFLELVTQLVSAIFPELPKVTPR
jgi:hypothetical protein